MQQVDTHTGCRTESVGPLRHDFGVESSAYLVHIVFTNRGKSLATDRVIKAQPADQVDTILEPDSGDVT